MASCVIRMQFELLSTTCVWSHFCLLLSVSSLPVLLLSHCAPSSLVSDSSRTLSTSQPQDFASRFLWSVSVQIFTRSAAASHPSGLSQRSPESPLLTTWHKVSVAVSSIPIWYHFLFYNLHSASHL